MGEHMGTVLAMKDLECIFVCVIYLVLQHP